MLIASLFSYLSVSKNSLNKMLSQDTFAYMRTSNEKSLPPTEGYFFKYMQQLWAS